MFNYSSSGNASKSAIIVPKTNARKSSSSAVPHRFNSTSEPRQIPIVRPELNSISKPKNKPKG